VDLVHDAGRQRTDRRELFGVRETHLRLAPFGDVLADGNDVRHLVALYFHWDFRYAIGALIAERGRFNGELLHLPRCEHALELAAQQVGGLPVKNFEYRAANGLFARNALHARLAFSIPRLNAIRPIDHVQTDRQRVDDLFSEATLLIDLPRARRDFGFE